MALRIEDLDAPRVVPGAEDSIRRDLEWLGLAWEGEVVHQSRRAAAYEAALERLGAMGRTYLCDCSRRELSLVASAPHEHDLLRYTGACRDKPRDRPMRRPPAVRLRTEPGDVVTVHDRILGTLREDVHAVTSDFVLRRGDGVFAYQLAVVVDDLAMGITEIVRGRDLASSTPRQALLARLLGQELPATAHVPMLVDRSGERLAKRSRSVTLAGLREAGVSAAEIVGALAGALGLAEDATPRTARSLVPWRTAGLGAPAVPAPALSPRPSARGVGGVAGVDDLQSFEGEHPSPPRATSMSAEVDLAPGDVLQRKYRLLERLGEGGMAEVWLAHNAALDVQVAVKVMRREFARDPRAVTRFRREARITASLQHKNIVKVYDFGITSRGAPFLVMELLAGETLAARLKRRGRLPPTEAVRVVLLALKGITVAHAQGIVHRDLKPENVFLAIEDGGSERPKILDFGVSSLARAGSDQTTRSTPVGTPAYLPPEVIREDRRGDARGDVWALGLLLYECLHGSLPWVSTTTHQLLESICHDEVPSLKDVPGVDDELDAIVHRALSKSPASRFPGARELFDALNAWLGVRADALALSSSMPRLRQAVSADPHADDSPTTIGPSLPSSPPSEGGVARTHHRPKERRQTASRAPWMIGVAGIGAIGAMAWLGTQARPSLPQPASPPVVESSSATPPPAASSDRVMLRIEDLPEDAKVYVNGQRVELPLEVRRGETQHTRVEAEGYLPWEQVVTAEGSVRLVYNASPKPRAAPKTQRGYKDVPY